MIVDVPGSIAYIFPRMKKSINPHRPDVRPGKGFRILEDGEAIQAGDEVQYLISRRPFKLGWCDVESDKANFGRPPVGLRVNNGFGAIRTARPLVEVELKTLAKANNITLGIHKGNGIGRDGLPIEGEITLDAPDGFQFDTDLHGLVIRQGRDAKGQLEPWQHALEQALSDLKAYKLTECPDSCECKEDPHDW